MRARRLSHSDAGLAGGGLAQLAVVADHVDGRPAHVLQALVRAIDCLLLGSNLGFDAGGAWSVAGVRAIGPGRAPLVGRCHGDDKPTASRAARPVGCAPRAVQAPAVWGDPRTLDDLGGRLYSLASSAHGCRPATARVGLWSSAVTSRELVRFVRAAAILLRSQRGPGMLACCRARACPLSASFLQVPSCLGAARAHRRPPALLRRTCFAAGVARRRPGHWPIPVPGRGTCQS